MGHSLESDVALLVQRLPVECGEQGDRLVSLLSVLKHLASFHRALAFIYIHCNYIDVRRRVGAARAVLPEGRGTAVLCHGCCLILR